MVKRVLLCSIEYSLSPKHKYGTKRHTSFWTQNNGFINYTLETENSQGAPASVLVQRSVWPPYRSIRCCLRLKTQEHLVRLGWSIAHNGVSGGTWTLSSHQYPIDLIWRMVRHHGGTFHWIINRTHGGSREHWPNIGGSDIRSESPMFPECLFPTKS